MMMTFMTVMMMHFFVFHFLLGGYLIKGVCILDIFRVNHFDSKWWVKYFA